MRFKEFIQINEAVDKDVMALQRELKAKGANLGTFGPKGDGIDGRLGKYTRRAAAANPDIAAKYKDVLARPDSVDAQKIDVTTIQDPDFKKKVEKIATLLGVRSSDLMAIMKQESGVNPAIYNKAGSGAVGLIQFMPKTAIALGTTTDELAKMDGVQQLDYVYKYFKMTGVGNGTLGDLYMAVFMPKYVGYDDETVLGRVGDPGFSGKVYAQNKGLDRNHDGSITVADVKSAVQRYA
jgi:hypothetical protein